MEKVVDWNCRAGGSFIVVLMLFQFDPQICMVCKSLCVPRLLWGTHIWPWKSPRVIWHQESQIHHGTALLSHMAQDHLDLTSKLPSSAEAFPRFPTIQTEQIHKSAPCLISYFLFISYFLLLLLVPRWSSWRQSPSLLHPPQAHNSIGCCCKGFIICMRLLQIFSFSQG